MRTLWLALLVIVAASNLSSSAQTRQTEFPEERLQALVGKTARLCGAVVDSSCRLGGDTVLHLWSRPPDRGITTRVPPSSRARFERAFEGRALGRDVCATGEQWRFDPGLHEGRPAPTRVVVSLTFSPK